MLVKCKLTRIAVTDFQKRSFPTDDGLSRPSAELRDDLSLVRYVRSFLCSHAETETA
jgi:hypothetical protein